jgi:hypothetical protein
VCVWEGGDGGGRVCVGRGGRRWEGVCGKGAGGVLTRGFNWQPGKAEALSAGQQALLSRGHLPGEGLQVGEALQVIIAQGWAGGLSLRSLRMGGGGVDTVFAGTF